MIRILRLAVLVATVGCGAAGSAPRADSLQARVDSLERRVARLEQLVAPRPDGSYPPQPLPVPPPAP